MGDKDYEQLRFEKLEKEIELIDQKLQAKDSSKNDIEGRIKGWLTLILTGTGIIAAVWGIIEGISKYNDRIEQESELKLNERMVNLVGQLKYDSLRDGAIMLLKYSGKNAIPILTYKLQRTQELNSSFMIDTIVEIIKSDQKNRYEILKIILDEADLFFTNEFSKTNIDYMNIDGLRNYMQLFLKISHNSDLDTVIISRINDKYLVDVNKVVDKERKQALSAELDSIIKQIESN